MKKINKKGGVLSMLPKVFEVLAIIVIFAGIILVAVIDDFKSIDEFDPKSNYDNDDANDLSDKCPCGSDNVKQELNGKEWCVASLSAQECACANSYANSARQKDLKRKFVWQSDYFKYVNDKCLYTKDEGCRYLMAATLNELTNTAGAEHAIADGGSTCTEIPI